MNMDELIELIESKHPKRTINLEFHIDRMELEIKL